MNLIPVDVPGDGYVVPVVILERIGIFYIQDFLIAVGNNHRTRSRSNALLRACLGPCIGSLDAAFGVAR